MLDARRAFVSVDELGRDLQAGQWQKTDPPKLVVIVGPWVGLEDVHSHRQPAPNHHNQISCPRTGDTWDGSGGSPGHLRIFRRETRSEMKLISQNLLPQFWHASGNPSPTRAASFIHAIRNVS